MPHILFAYNFGIVGFMHISKAQCKIAVAPVH